MGVALVALVLQGQTECGGGLAAAAQRHCAVCGGQVICGAQLAAEGGTGLWDVSGGGEQGSESGRE